MVKPHQEQVHPQQLPLVLDSCKSCPRLCTGTLASSGYECHHMQHKHQKKVPKTVSILDIGVDHNDSSAPLASSTDTPDRGRDQKVSSLTSCFTSLTPHPVINTHHHHTLCTNPHLHWYSLFLFFPRSTRLIWQSSESFTHSHLWHLPLVQHLQNIWYFLEIRQC